MGTASSRFQLLVTDMLERTLGMSTRTLAVVEHGFILMLGEDASRGLDTHVGEESLKPIEARV